MQPITIRTWGNYTKRKYLEMKMKKWILLLLPLLYLAFTTGDSSSLVQAEDYRNHRPDFSERTYYSPQPNVLDECFKCKTNDKSMCKSAVWKRALEKADNIVYVCTPENKCRSYKLKEDRWFDFFVWEYEKNICTKQ